MAKFKGVGIVFMRKLIRSHPPEVEKQFLAKLSDDEKRLYESTLSASWVTLDLITKYCEIASPLLFPNEGRGLWEIGRLMALDNLKGIYKVIVRVLSPQTILTQGAKLWASYHEKGRASLRPSEDPRRASYIVEDYPEITAPFLELLRGYVYGALEACGAKDIEVNGKYDNPNHWEWHASWR